MKRKKRSAGEANTETESWYDKKCREDPDFKARRAEAAKERRALEKQEREAAVAPAPAASTPAPMVPAADASTSTSPGFLERNIPILFGTRAAASSSSNAAAELGEDFLVLVRGEAAVLVADTVRDVLKADPARSRVLLVGLLEAQTLELAAHEEARLEHGLVQRSLALLHCHIHRVVKAHANDSVNVHENRSSEIEPPKSFCTAAVWETYARVDVTVEIHYARVPRPLLEAQRADSLLLVSGELFPTAMTSLYSTRISCHSRLMY